MPIKAGNQYNILTQRLHDIMISSAGYLGESVLGEKPSRNPSIFLRKIPAEKYWVFNIPQLPAPKTLIHRFDHYLLSRVVERAQ